MIYQKIRYFNPRFQSKTGGELTSPHPGNYPGLDSGRIPAEPDPDVTFYGMNEFRLDDPDGNRLWIGQTTAIET